VTSVSPAAAATFRVHHQRQPALFGKPEHAIRLQVVDVALRAREYGVVVCHRGAARVLVVEAVTVHMADPRDQAVGGTHALQVGGLAAAALRGERELAVLEEITAVEEVRELFARRAAPLRAPFGVRVRARFVAQCAAPSDDFAEVRTQLVEIDGGLAGRVLVVNVGRLHEENGIAGVEDRARMHGDRAHDSGKLGGEDVLHLHCLEEREALAACDARSADVFGGPCVFAARRSCFAGAVVGRCAGAAKLCASPAATSCASATSSRACSATKRVCTSYAATSGRRSSAVANGRFVATPAMRNSRSVRSANAAACAKSPSAACTITLASSESKPVFVR